MSTTTLPHQVGECAPRTTGLCLFPRMEKPGQWNQLVIPLGDGWEATMLQVLKPTRIPEAADPRRASRKTKQGLLGAKSCAPGVTPYLLAQGGSRGKRDALRHDLWTWLPIDLDAVPIPVERLGQIVRDALADVKIASWTTWSCKDGYASMRVLVPLAREVTLNELIPIWWWARRRLVDAGLPAESAKAGEPANDSRALDARLFYLPAAPMPMVPGTEGWGGVVPCGYVSPDGVPVLDPGEVLEVGRRIRAEDEPEHLVQWPSVPVPGAGPTAMTRKTLASSGRRGPGGNGPAETVDFSTITMFGEVEGDLRAWAEHHLPQPGTEVSIGSVFDQAIWDPGDRATAYQTCRLHRDQAGRLWAHDFRSGISYFDDAYTVSEGDTGLEVLDSFLADGGEVEPDESDSADTPADPGDAEWNRMEPVQEALERYLRRLYYERADLQKREREAACAAYRAEWECQFRLLADVLGLDGGACIEDLASQNEILSALLHMYTQWSSAEKIADNNAFPSTSTGRAGSSDEHWCSGGMRIAGAREGDVVVRRAPCWRWSCPVCGPRRGRALAACAATIVRRLVSGSAAWAGVVVEADPHDGAFERALRRWRAVAREHRHYVGAGSPGRELLLVFWDGEKQAPRGGHHRHFVRLGATQVTGRLDDAIEALCRTVYPDERPRTDKSQVVRGAKDLVHTVSTLQVGLHGVCLTQKKDVPSHRSGPSPSRLRVPGPAAGFGSGACPMTWATA